MKKINLLTLLACLFVSTIVWGADYYWVGGAGNWSDHAHHWALTSGGQVFHNGTPTANDNVYFDINSFTGPNQTVTVDTTTATFKTMDWTGVKFNPTFYAKDTLNFNYAIKIYGSLILDPNMIWDVDAYLDFESITTGNTIHCAGHALIKSDYYFLRLLGNGSVWSLTDDLYTSEIVTIEIHKGVEFNTNNYNINCGSFVTMAAHSSIKINLGTSTITCGSGRDFGISPNVTIDATQATIKINPFGTFSANGKIYNHLILSSDCYINGDTCKINKLELSGNTTINGNYTTDTLVFNGSGYITTIKAGITLILGHVITNNNCGEYLQLQSSESSQQANLFNTESTTLNYFLLKGLNAIGTFSFTANNSVDGGYNTGWIINAATPRTLYWVGGTGKWSETAHWALSSGGAGGNCIPSAADTVLFDANSFSVDGDSVITDIPTFFCNTIDWSGISHKVHFGLSKEIIINDLYYHNHYSMNIRGSFTLSNKLKWNFFSQVLFSSTSNNNTITTNGCLLVDGSNEEYSTGLIFDGAGTWQLMDSLTIVDFNTPTMGSIEILKGNFITNGNYIAAGGIGCYGGNTRGFDISNSTIITGSWIAYANIANDDPSQLTLTTTNSTITINWPYPNYRGDFFGAGKEYNHVKTIGPVYFGDSCYHHQVEITGDITIDQPNQFDTLYFNNPNHKAILPAGMTQWINHYLEMSSVCSGYITLESSSPTNPAILNKVTDSVVVSYAFLNNITATGGALFRAKNSLATGNTSGWTVETAPFETLYWIGGNGNWSDVNHWSLSSGGPSAGCAPGPVTSVIFDKSSFPSPNNNTVMVDISSPMCNDMDWSTATNSPVFASIDTISISNNLMIYGDMKLNNTMDWQYRGNIRFEAEGKYVHIETAGQRFKNRFFQSDDTIIFNGALSTWNLKDNLYSMAPIKVNKGNLVSNANTIVAQGIYANGKDISSINLSTSSVYTNVVVLSTTINTNLTVMADSCMINLVKSMNPFYSFGCGINAKGFTFGNITMEEISYSILENNTIGTLRMMDEASIEGDSNTYKNLYFDNPGRTVKLTPAVNFVDNLIVNSKSGYPVYIESMVNGYSATFKKTSDTVCINYVNLKGIKGAGGAVFYAGANSVNSGNNTGWLFQSCKPPVSDVWPGDANNDLTANYLDLLSIGVAYGETDTTRTNASNNWTAQPAYDWQAIFSNGTNIKHADCDGNGIINADDTVAIALNYSQTHNKKEVDDNFNITATTPPLFPVFYSPFLFPGQQSKVAIHLGNDTLPAYNFYGLACSIDLDTTFIEPNSIYITFDSSWVGIHNQDMLTMHRVNGGHTELALTRTDRQNRDGFGKLGDINFTLKTKITSDTVVKINIVYSNAITNKQGRLALNKKGGKVKIILPTSTHNLMPEKYIHVFPTPAKDLLNIILPDSPNAYTVSVINMLGQEISTSSYFSSFNMPVSQLSNGVYYLKITNGDSVYTKKVTIQH